MPAHDRLVHRVSPGVRPAHLDPYDLTALRGGHHDRRVHVAAAPDDGRVAGGVDPGDVRDEMRERRREPRRASTSASMGGACTANCTRPGPDQLDGPVDTGRDDRVEHAPSYVRELSAPVSSRW